MSDLAAACNKNEHIASLFTVGSHHNNLSIILLTQNLFSHGRESRLISLNCSYIVLWRNPRDCSQVDYLSRQMFPKDGKRVTKAYQLATEKIPHSYLFIDFKQATDDDLRLRTNVLPGEGDMLILVNRFLYFCVGNK